MRGAHLAFPFRAAPLLLVAVFTIGLLIALNAGLVGIFLSVLLVSWFFKYCFIMLDAIVAGEEEPPVLSVEMVNPLSEQRPLAAGAVIGGGAWLVFLAQRTEGAALSIALAAVLLAALPASIAALGVTGNPLKAIWPGVWLACVRGLGWDYLWLALAVLAFGASIYGLWRIDAPMWISLAASQLLFLLIVAFIGAAVHAHRHDLGVATLTRAERRAARDERDLTRERRGALDRAYGLLRVHKPVEAWSQIDTWLEAQRARTENMAEYHRVFEAVSKWDDVRIGDRVAEELIGLLLARRDTGLAVEVCERWIAANPRYEPSHRKRLAELASLAGKRALARRLSGA